MTADVAAHVVDQDVDPSESIEGFANRTAGVLPIQGIRHDRQAPVTPYAGRLQH